MVGAIMTVMEKTIDMEDASGNKKKTDTVREKARRLKNGRRDISRLGN